MEPIRVLMIEDDEEMCEELVKILREENYNVDVTYDGSKGLQFIESNRYDVVLLDLKMREISGYEVLRHIKSRHLQLKVIVLTGTPINEKNLDTAEEAVFPLGEGYKTWILKLADGVINKPFEVEDVLTALKRLTRF